MKMISNGLTSAYVLLVSMGVLWALILLAVASPGCTGPPAARPCDFITIAKRSLPHYDRYLGFRIEDLGSSVSAHQPASLGWTDDAPSVLIDKRSCRVCEVSKLSGSGPLLQTVRADLPGGLDAELGVDRQRAPLSVPGRAGAAAER